MTPIPGRLGRLRPSDDSGFTLLEVISTCMIASILLGLSAMPFREYQRKQEHQGTTRVVVAALRHAQVASVAEGVSYAVDTAADGKTVTVKRLGATEAVVRTVKVSHASVTVSAPTFTGPSGTSSRAMFYPRGSATPGTLDITVEGSSKVYRIRVEGLTGRVSYDN